MTAKGFHIIGNLRGVIFDEACNACVSFADFDTFCGLGRGLLGAQHGLLSFRSLRSSQRDQPGCRIRSKVGVLWRRRWRILELSRQAGHIWLGVLRDVWKLERSCQCRSFSRACNGLSSHTRQFSGGYPDFWTPVDCRAGRHSGQSRGGFLLVEVSNRLRACV